MARRIMLNGTSYFGQGAIQEIVNEIKNRHFKKALVTSTPDLFEFKVATKVTELLNAAGIAYEVYDGIKPNPTIENVTAGVEACKADVEKNRKFVCVDPHDIPIVAIVDPDMSASMPTGLCAATGMDALVHAVEGYITKGAWELTDMLHLKAIEIIGRSLRSAVAGDYAGREAMSLGQYIAGMGFSNVGLGIVHSMAHPLSAVYDIPHGKACAMLLTAVLKFNAPATGEKYREIARVMGVPHVDTMDESTYRQAAIDVIQKLADDVGIPKSLSEAGVKREDIPFLAESAFNDACTPGNPRDASLEEIIGIYESIF